MLLWACTPCVGAERGDTPAWMAPLERTQDDWRLVLTFHQEVPTTGHLALDIGGRAAIAPTVPGPCSQQAEVMASAFFINLNHAFSSPHGGTFQEPGHFRLWGP